MLVLSLDIRYSHVHYMFLIDVTHKHSDKKWVPQSRSPKIFFAGLPPRPPPKWQLLGRQPTPDRNFSLQRPVVETFVGGAELLRRGGRCLEGPCSCGTSTRLLCIRPAAIIALIIISSGPCTPGLLPNDGGYSTSS